MHSAIVPEMLRVLLLAVTDINLPGFRESMHHVRHACRHTTEPSTRNLGTHDAQVLLAIGNLR